MLTRDRGFYKSFAALAGALMAEQTVILSVNLIDNLMLGSYSETALAGVAAVNQLQFVLQQVIYGVSNSMIVLGSQYFGQGRTGEVKKIAAIAARVALGIALMLFIAVSAAPQGALALFTRDAAIAREGVAYLSITRWSYTFFALATVMLGAMRIAGTVKIAIIASVTSLAINVGINLLLIRGRLGFPELGARGAAIGTLTAWAAELTIVGAFMFRRDKRLRMRPADFLRIDGAMLRDYTRVGAPIIGMSVAWGVASAAQTMILGHMSDSAIAAQSISNPLFMVLKVAAVGASSAASILIGRAVGAGDMGKIREYTRTLQVLFVCIGAMLAGLFAAVAFPLLGVYRVSDETRQMARWFIMIQTLTMFTMSYQMPVNAGIIRGGGDVQFVLVLDLVSLGLIVFPLATLGAFYWRWSPVAVIFALNSDQIFKCVPAFLRVNSYRWIRKLTRPEGAR